MLLVGVPFWERVEIKDLLAYLRLAASLSDDLAVERIINVPSRKIGKVSLTALKAYATAQEASLSGALFLGSLFGDGEGVPPAQSIAEVLVRADFQQACVPQHLQK